MELYVKPRVRACGIGRVEGEEVGGYARTSAARWAFLPNVSENEIFLVFESREQDIETDIGGTEDRENTVNTTDNGVGFFCCGGPTYKRKVVPPFVMQQQVLVTHSLLSVSSQWVTLTRLKAF